MDIATFNVNSVRARLEGLTRWLEEARPDAVCLQETKCVDAQFPRQQLEDLGYHVAVHGQKTYNGVAILSRAPLEDVSRGIAGLDDPQARVISASTLGLRLRCLYVPNGSEVGSDKYRYKLAWLDALLAELAGCDPGSPLVLCGDFNIAPDDRDLWDPDGWRERILCSTPERQRFQLLLDWGLHDAQRLLSDEPGLYTWWDYRGGAYWRGKGMRIDHFLVSEPLVGRCAALLVQRRVRQRKRPSDHAPVVLTLAASGAPS